MNLHSPGARCYPIDMSLLSAHRSGFPTGLTKITTSDDPEFRLGFAIHKFEAGEHAHTTSEETAWLLVNGQMKVHLQGQVYELQRSSLFDDLPSAVHMPAGCEARIECSAPVELIVCNTPNSESFPAKVYQPAEVRDEHRGKGGLRDAAYRFVRTIFDGTNTPDAAQLVLGEVINMPGRWSSYPPHHHAQPEIYHYRFTKPQGYGHAEMGEAVYKVRENDTLKISGGQDHSQCAAPGYGMYYVWVIRHLPGERYTTPEFTEDHAWTLDQGAQHWWPDRTEDA